MVLHVAMIDGIILPQPLEGGGLDDPHESTDMMRDDLKGMIPESYEMFTSCSFKYTGLCS